MLAFHGAHPPPRADQRARAARPSLPRALGAGGELLHRAHRGAAARARQYADPAARRAAHAARHRPHARLVHLPDQWAAVLVRGVLREGIQRRRILVRGARRDRLRPHLLGGERALVRPPARRRRAARPAPLAKLRELQVVDLLRREPGSPRAGARRPRRTRLRAGRACPADRPLRASPSRNTPAGVPAAIAKADGPPRRAGWRSCRRASPAWPPGTNAARARSAIACARPWA